MPALQHKSTLLPQGALIEFVVIGAYVRVAAVDPVTREEVTLVGDASQGREILTRQAVRKLEYVLSRKKGATGQQGGGAGSAGDGGQGKGDPADAAIRRGKRPENPSGWDL